MSAICSPFINGQNAEVFDAMLAIRWKEWDRINRNRKQRRRYREKKHEKRSASSQGRA